jgi:hypothetical protein
MEQKKRLNIIEKPNGDLGVQVTTVERYPILKYETEDNKLAGTELYFEGKVWFPVLDFHKTDNGYGCFMDKAQMYFWNPNLQEEETELSIQSYFKEIDGNNWRDYRDELINLSWTSIQIAFNEVLK